MVTGAQVLADQLKKVGIELEIKQYEYGVWLERFNTHQFELAWNVTGRQRRSRSAAQEPPALEGWQPEQLDRHRDRHAAGRGQADHGAGEAEGALHQRPEGAGAEGAASLDVLQRPDPRHESSQGIRVAPLELLPGAGHDLAGRLTTFWVLSFGNRSPKTQNPKSRSPTRRVSVSSGHRRTYADRSLSDYLGPGM